MDDANSTRNDDPIEIYKAFFGKPILVLFFRICLPVLVDVNEMEVE